MCWAWRAHTKSTFLIELLFSFYANILHLGKVMYSFGVQMREGFFTFASFLCITLLDSSGSSIFLSCARHYSPFAVLSLMHCTNTGGVLGSSGS
jgi:hypothetical protein